MIGSGEHPMFAFGWPHDRATSLALLCALLCFLPVGRFLWGSERRVLLCLVGLCAGAFALSLAYYFVYLGGQPRLIDATTYLFQARSLSHGSFGWTVPSPSASFRGRFIVTTARDPHTVAGIFPPGYPALLSLGERLHHFELVGPVLGASLVIATYALARRLFRDRRTALLAAALSMLCACLRYHTADTMSHGWSALLTTLALTQTVALFGRSNLAGSSTLHNSKYWGLGLCLGLLVCTRQLTGVLLSLGCLLPLLVHRETRSQLLRSGLLKLGLAATPALVFLLAQHDFITGSPFQTPQHYYYARADGPPGCFALGLGAGCHYEHADAVATQGGRGLTWGWSLLNTLHRLHWHALDIANFEPLILVALWCAWRLRARRPLHPLLCTLLVIPLGYSQFYFNGSYPGGGARFFSEMLPIWHVLLAAGLLRLGWARWGIALTLFGFSVHASWAHDQLASAHFGPSSQHFDGLKRKLVPRASDVSPALVFFSSAHHFHLAAQSSTSFIAARSTQDSREVWLASPFPSDRVFRFDPERGLLPWQARAEEQAHISLESEFDYPVLSVGDGWVSPQALSHPCVSGGYALKFERIGPRPELTLELTGAPPGLFHVEADWVAAERAGTPCSSASLGIMQLPLRLTLDLRAWPGATHIDRLRLSPALDR